MLVLPMAALHRNQPPAIILNDSYDIPDLHSPPSRHSTAGASGRIADRTECQRTNQETYSSSTSIQPGSEAGRLLRMIRRRVLGKGNPVRNAWP